MKKILAFLILLIGVVLVSGCVQSPEQEAKEACIKLCQQELLNGRDLSGGPCLSNGIIEGWVCDVAHSPREPADDLSHFN